MKQLYTLLALFLFHQVAFSQTEIDIVRYSQITNTGSARSAAMGGAFGALGGDLTNLGNNPAGIGVFRKSEISITPSLNIANTVSNNKSIRNSSFQLGALGAVISMHNENFDWRGFNFGISYTGQNNFNRKTNQFVYDSPNSILDAWANQATLDFRDGYLIPERSEMAEKVGLIQFNKQDSTFHAKLDYNTSVNQHNYIKEDGYQGEYNFSFGTNYKDILYLGVSVGIQSIRYKYRSTYTETAPADNSYDLDQYYFNTYLTTEGAGSNIKVGAIFRPFAELRIGASIHSPTYYSMNDNYSEAMNSYFTTLDEDGYNEYSVNTESSRYNYEMQTSWKAVFSLATVLVQRVIISADYEFNNYKSAKFGDSAGGFDYDAPGEANENIKTYLKNTNNLRVGAEFRVSSIFSLRGGYTYLDSPYRNTDSGKIQSYSGGFGLNFGSFYCDASYTNKFSENTTLFYDYLAPTAEDSAYDIISSSVNNKYSTHEAKITFGVKF